MVIGSLDGCGREVVFGGVFSRCRCVGLNGVDVFIVGVGFGVSGSGGRGCVDAASPGFGLNHVSPVHTML